MVTAGVPSGTILAVHLQKCSHLSNEIRVMQNTTEIVYDNKNLHITELEDTRLVFILFYFILFISNKR
jgi:hypothetical protein